MKKYKGNYPMRQYMVDMTLAVLTHEYLYLTQPSGGSTPPGPSCNLPGSPGRDMCMLSSEEYPTDIAAIAMSGTSGPALCAIATSWPTEVEQEHSNPVDPGIQLLSNPGTGGITILNGASPKTISILDLTGRCIREVHLGDSQVQFISLPAGIYHIVNTEEIHNVTRAIVVSN